MTWVKTFSLSGWMAFSDKQFSPGLCLVPCKFYSIRVLFYSLLPYSEVILKAKAVSARKVMQDYTRPLEVVYLILCVKQHAAHFQISPLSSCDSSHLICHLEPYPLFEKGSHEKFQSCTSLLWILLYIYLLYILSVKSFSFRIT